MGTNNKAPTIRGDCVDGLRPCPWIRCKFHLLGDRVNKAELNKLLNSIVVYWTSTGRNGGYLGSLPDDPDPDEAIVDYIVNMRQTCALDLADKGENTLEAIGDALNVSRERVRQIAGGGRHPGALKKLARGQRRQMMKGHL